MDKSELRRCSRSLARECFYFSDKAHDSIKHFEKVFYWFVIPMPVVPIALFFAGNHMEDNDGIFFAGFVIMVSLLWIPIAVTIVYKKYAMRYIAIPDVIEKCAEDVSFARKVLRESSNSQLKEIIQEKRKLRE